MIEKLGFKIVPDYSGELSSGRNFQAGLITLEKVEKRDPELTVEGFLEDLTKDEREGLKFRDTKAKVRDTRKVATSFTLNGESIETKLNGRDKLILEEEQDVIRQADAMKSLYEGRIKAIPSRTIVESGFVRIRLGEKYVLFKRLSKKAGVVVVR